MSEALRLLGELAAARTFDAVRVAAAAAAIEGAAPSAAASLRRAEDGREAAVAAARAMRELAQAPAPTPTATPAERQTQAPVREMSAEGRRKQRMNERREQGRAAAQQRAIAADRTGQLAPGDRPVE